MLRSRLHSKLICQKCCSSTPSSRPRPNYCKKKKKKVRYCCGTCFISQAFPSFVFSLRTGIIRIRVRSFSLPFPSSFLLISTLTLRPAHMWAGRNGWAPVVLLPWLSADTFWKQFAVLCVSSFNSPRVCPIKHFQFSFIPLSCLLLLRVYLQSEHK